MVGVNAKSISAYMIYNKTIGYSAKSFFVRNSMGKPAPSTESVFISVCFKCGTIPQYAGCFHMFYG